MERLTEKQSSGYDLKAMNGEYCNRYCEQQRVETCNECVIYQAIQKLAEYEDLEEQGLLLRLPCKVGDTVYFLGSKCDKCEEDDCYGCPYNRNGEKRDDRFVYDMVVEQFRICNNSVYIVDTDAVWSSSEISLNINQFGNTVFLTKAEAEQKLKEMESD